MLEGWLKEGDEIKTLVPFSWASADIPAGTKGRVLLVRESLYLGIVVKIEFDNPPVRGWVMEEKIRRVEREDQENRLGGEV